MPDIPNDIEALASSRELEEAKEFVANLAKQQVPEASSDDPEYLKRLALVRTLFSTATAQHVDFMMHDEQLLVFATLRRYLRPDNNPMLPIQDVGCYVQYGVEKLPPRLRKTVIDFAFANAMHREDRAMDALWKDVPVGRTYTEIRDRMDLLQSRYDELMEKIDQE